MGKRTLEEMASKEDNTIQDSVVHSNCDENDNSAQDSSSNNQDDPMVSHYSKEFRTFHVSRIG